MTVDIVTTPQIPTAVVREATTWDAFPSRWKALLDEVWAFARAGGVQAGRNVMLYQDDVPNVEVGVEALERFSGDGRVVASSLPAGEAAMTVQRGPPSADGIGAAHAAVRSWCAAHGHELTGLRWEIYGHWRGDPADYEIEVYWLLR